MGKKSESSNFFYFTVFLSSLAISAPPFRYVANRTVSFLRFEFLEKKHFFRLHFRQKKTFWCTWTPRVYTHCILTFYFFTSLLERTRFLASYSSIALKIKKNNQLVLDRDHKVMINILWRRLYWSPSFKLFFSASRSTSHTLSARPVRR